MIAVGGNVTATSVETFFDGSVRSGAPSVKLSQVNDGVIGEIVDQFMAEQKEFGSDEVKKDKKTGEVLQQLVVIVQTDLRNWDRVAKIPKVDPSDRNSADKAPSEDDGKRAIYIAPYTNIHSAVGKATAAKNGGKPTALANGARLGLKVVKLEDVGKGNPKKVFEAFYEPQAVSDNFFGAEKSAGGPNDASTQAQSAPSQQQSQPVGDPWATGGGAASEAPSEPPF